MFLMGLHLFCGVTFILLEIFPGAFVCFLLGILYMINYIYAYKEKEISILVLIAYAIVCTVLGMFTTNTYALNILPTVFAILTIIGIYFEKNKKVYRILEIAQSTIWTIYTLCTGAFMIAISSATVVGLVLRDVYRYDINKEVEPTTGLEIDLAAEEAERNMQRAILDIKRKYLKMVMIQEMYYLQVNYLIIIKMLLFRQDYEVLRFLVKEGIIRKIIVINLDIKDCKSI